MGVFVGRQKELELFWKELDKSSHSSDAKQIFYLKAPDKYGKKAFYTELWNKLKKNQTPYLYIRPIGFISADESIPWTNFFVFSMQSNEQPLTDLIKNLQLAVVQENTSDGRSKENPNNPTGSMPIEQVGNNNHFYDEKCFELFLTEVLVQSNGRGSNKKKNCLLFVLDDYDMFPVEKKEWFSKLFFQQLSDFFDWDIRYLLSGKTSFFSTPDILSNWAPLEEKVLELELPPLSFDEASFLLKKKGIPSDKFREFFGKSSGIPGNLSMEANLSLVGEEKGTLDIVQQKVAGFSDSEKKKILYFAHLGLTSEEAIKIFGTETDVHGTFQWLIDQINELSQELKPDQMSEFLNSLLEWQKQSDPRNFISFANNTCKYQKILASFPEEKSRQIMTQLSIFNYFDEALINKIYPDQCEAIIRFLRNNPQYSIRSDVNWQLKPEFKRVIQIYRELLKIQNDPIIQEKIKNIWNDKYASTIQEIEKRENEIYRKEEEKAKITKQLNPLIQKLEKKQKQFRTPEPTHPTARSSSLAWNVMLEIMGVTLLYAGMLLFENVSLTYVICGCILVILGLFRRQKKSLPYQPQAPQQETRITDSADQFLKIQLAQLEFKREQTSRDVLANKKSLKKLQQLLEEQYYI
ncbi:MAG: hypothetical protein A2007_03735 [Verrucomicrobia bacterium GWC2_42_7]|nr:MAG: hypothetical protein A2007_03735 [Verrucomicrobia bacterium GWC2_42_7]